MYIDSFYLLKGLGYSAITTIHVQLEFEQGHPDSFDYYNQLIKIGDIEQFPLEIEDLIEMSNVPQSKRASDAELSCFVVAKRIGGKAMTDDNKAIKYIKRYLHMPPGSVIQLIDILIEAYLENYLGDHDLKSIQKTLKDNNFNIKNDLVAEAARRRWMTGGYNQMA